MLEAEADLWTFPAEYRCITTSGVVNAHTQMLVMGKGTALEAKQRFPELPAKLGRWVKQYGNRPFICRAEGIITFPTKADWRKPSSTSLIEISASKIVEIVDKYDIQTVVLPRPGCGNGGLDWFKLRPILQNIFDDRFTVCFKVT